MATSGDTEIAVRALAVINEERNIHGMRYNDYARYRKHCASKVHRLRQTLHLLNGKEKTFKKPPPVLIENLKDGHLLLDLFEAERAWAYAQELLLDHAKNKSGATRRHALSRFRKAIQWATQLQERSSTLYTSSPPRISATSHAEIVAYALMLQGRFSRTKDQFDSALTQLSVARSLLDTLTASATSSRDQALYAVFVDEISPEIRYCAHQMGRAKAYDIDAIVADVAPKAGEGAVAGYSTLLAALKPSTASGSTSDLEPVTWEGQPVPIRSPELVDAFLKVQHAVRLLESHGKKSKASTTSNENTHAKASRGKIAAFDGVLSALSDAESLSRRLAESQRTSAAQAASGPGARDAHFIHAFVSFQLLAYRIQRDLLLVDALLQPNPDPRKLASSSKADPSTVDIRVYPAVIKTLDTVLQSLDQMRSLSITDESQDVSAALDIRLYVTRAKRSRYLSLAHAGVKNYAASVALNSGSQLHIREARSTIDTSSSITPPEVTFYPLDPEKDVTRLSETLEEDALRLKKEWYAFNGGGTTKAKKPLFFDVAFNYIESPMERIQQRAGKAPPPVAVREEKPKPTAKGRVDREEVEEEETPAPSPAAPASGGITGFLGSWWGRK